MTGAYSDIYDDFEELLFLVAGYKKSLLQFKKELFKAGSASRFLTNQIDQLTKSFEDIDKQIQILQTKIKASKVEKIDYFSSKKRKLFLELRSVIPLVGSLITSTDWQSPSFEHSLHSEAGIQEGKIIAHINDYKRDQHLNERAYQEHFLREYVDGLKIPSSAYLTSSGMAALTTIITFLKSKKNVKGHVVIGKSSYFENIELVETFFNDRTIIKVDEMDTHSILKIFDQQVPDLIFLDSLCNTPTVAVPEIHTILKYASDHAKKDTFFIIDNSTLSIALQPLKKLRLPNKIKLIVFESLNKYHQFGLDRATGGIIWFRGTGMEELYDARDHAGTNIVDACVYSLPTPSRKHLQKRLDRLNRNAIYLAQNLHGYIQQHNLKTIDGIVYPGLSDHPSYKWAKDYSFQGSYFVIRFKREHRKVSEYQRFVTSLIQNARKQKVALTGGTSFGFNTTRVYLTAKNSDFGEPFVRVSLGTENLMELEKIKDVFESTLQSF